MNRNRDAGRTIGAIILIGLGALFLLGQTFGFHSGNVLSFSWPFFIIIPGVLLLAVAVSGGRSAAGFIFPGLIVTGTGVILWVQNTLDYYQSWAYMWALYPALVGTGMIFVGFRTGNDNVLRSGRGLVAGGLTALVVFAAFFEVFIFQRFGGLTNYLVPALLILGGLFLLMGGRLPGAPEKRKHEPAYTSPANGDKPKHNGYPSGVNADLQRRIDEALAEDDPNEPRTSV